MYTCNVTLDIIGRVGISLHFLLVLSVTLTDRSVVWLLRSSSRFWELSAQFPPEHKLIRASSSSWVYGFSVCSDPSAHLVT